MRPTMQSVNSYDTLHVAVFRPRFGSGYGDALYPLSSYTRMRSNMSETSSEPLEGINQTGFAVADGKSMVAVQIKNGQFWVDFTGEDRLTCAGMYKRQDWS
ncbi:uncharacterized protein SPPG_01721 [Spizellomyces punctatus DAOM BR117]|uniref:Uncharacterized protein n=1 Tax=Spizellomyces punctatus (strain DAOM BR117) TaxID=645134 RepID=A0A0L0HNL4_SPIPD|nr:uncharacterized protein SPPG_01721 [Spizellomyces punctatus DAOM BR117]KND02633.1 hypothetical protein SPPG_01721 [Spizellomyces punctatus DAOM BR117]|eukprot:XP_016610672.1 hypothetical protein SPPG_01721 [Spizellomyces punctatus DAOM BR117]